MKTEPYERRLRCVGGRMNYTYQIVPAHYSTIRCFVMDKVVGVDLLSDMRPIAASIEAVLYTVRVVRVGKDYDLAFLAPSDWTDEAALMFALA